MTASDFLKAIRGMSSETQARFAAEVIGDNDGFKCFRRELDRFVNRAVKTHEQKLADRGVLSDRDELSGRLDKIEADYRTKVRALELGYYAKEKARELGFDPVLLDGKYPDEQSIDQRAEIIGNAVKRKADADMNLAMINTPKPGSGLSPSPSKPKTQAEWNARAEREMR